MIDPADMAPIEAKFSALSARITVLEAELAVLRGTMTQRQEQPDAPARFVRAKPNAPPHGEDSLQ